MKVKGTKQLGNFRKGITISSKPQERNRLVKLVNNHGAGGGGGIQPQNVTNTKPIFVFSDIGFRNLSYIGKVNGKPKYTYGDEYLEWDGSQWVYGNVYSGIIGTSSSNTNYPWDAADEFLASTWTNNVSVSRGIWKIAVFNAGAPSSNGEYIWDGITLEEGQPKYLNSNNNYINNRGQVGVWGLSDNSSEIGDTTYSSQDNMSSWVSNSYGNVPSFIFGYSQDSYINSITFNGEGGELDGITFTRLGGYNTAFISSINPDLIIEYSYENNTFIAKNMSEDPVERLQSSNLFAWNEINATPPTSISMTYGANPYYSILSLVPTLNNVTPVYSYDQIHMNISFQPVFPQECYINKLKYKIRADGDNYEDAVDIADGDWDIPAGTATIFAGLQYDTNYFIKIYAQNCAGESLESNEIQFYVDFQAPNAPNMQLGNIGQDEIMIYNYSIDEYFDGGCETNFYYEMVVDNTPEDVEWNGEWNQFYRLDHLYLNLEKGHTYIFRFKAENCAGESVSSQTVYFEYPFGQPEAPNIYFDEQTSSYVHVSIGGWDELYNGGCNTNYSYSIYIPNTEGGDGEWSAYTPFPSLEEGFTINNMPSQGIVYKIKVKAENCTGVPVYSNILEYTGLNPSPVFQDFDPEFDLNQYGLFFSFSDTNIGNPDPNNYPLNPMEFRAVTVDRNTDENGNFTGYDPAYFNETEFIQLSINGAEGASNHLIPFEQTVAFAPNQSYAIQFRISNDAGSAISNTFYFTSSPVPTAPSIISFDPCYDSSKIICSANVPSMPGIKNGEYDIYYQLSATNSLGTQTEIVSKEGEPGNTIDISFTGLTNHIRTRTSSFKLRVSNYKNLAWSPWSSIVSFYVPEEC